MKSKNQLKVYLHGVNSVSVVKHSKFAFVNLLHDSLKPLSTRYEGGILKSAILLLSHV